MKDIKDKIKDALIHIGALGIIASGFAFPANALLIYFLGLPVVLVSSAKAIDAISQNKIKDSIFSVTKKGYITQNALAKPGHMFKLAKSKDKSKNFIKETYNMFMQLTRTNKKGEVIKYQTVSHSITYRLLSTLQKKGYITNLTREKEKKRRLLFEKMAFGNKEGINKKYQFYKITFELTDKKFDLSLDEVSQILGVGEVAHKTLDVGKNNTEKIERLKELRSELIKASNVSQSEINEEVIEEVEERGRSR